MLLLAEYVPATMLDPKALGTAFDIHWQLVLGGAARTLSGGLPLPPNWGG